MEIPQIIKKLDNKAIEENDMRERAAEPDAQRYRAFSETSISTDTFGRWNGFENCLIPLAITNHEDFHSSFNICGEIAKVMSDQTVDSIPLKLSYRRYQLC